MKLRIIKTKSKLLDSIHNHYSKLYKYRKLILVLENEYELAILEFDYLHSPEEIQKKIDKHFKKK